MGNDGVGDAPAAGAAGGAGSAGAAPSPSVLRIDAAFAGAAFPHSFAASTPARPLTSAEPCRRLESSPARSLQFGAVPPLSAAGIVLTPFALPLIVSATFPDAATPRGRMTAIASLPPFTPPATVTPAGADLTFTLLTPDANVTDTWPSAGIGAEGVAANAGGLDISRTPRAIKRELGEHGGRCSRPEPARTSGRTRKPEYGYQHRSFWNAYMDGAVRSDDRVLSDLNG